MGCGSSSAAAAGGLGKDPEDLYLDYIQFRPMKVPVFDDFLFDKVTPVVNKVVDICNDLNGALDDIKDAGSAVAGAFRANVSINGVKATDTVVLALQKADGTFPSKEEVVSLPDTAKAADKKLSAARKVLVKEMEAKYVALQVVDDQLAVGEGAEAPAALATFNAALEELRGAIGAEMKLVVVVKPAGVGGADSLRASLEAPVFSKDGEITWTPAGVLAVAQSNSAKALFAAEQSVGTALAKLSTAVKAARDAKIKVDLELSRKNLKAKMPEAKRKRKAKGKGKGKSKSKSMSMSMFGGGGDGEGEGEGEAEAEAEEEPEAEAEAEEEAEPEAEAEAEAEGEGEGEGKAAKADTKIDAEAEAIAEDKKDAVRKAVTTLNQQLFKLCKAARNATTDVNLAKAFVLLMTSFKERGMELAKSNGKEFRDVLSFAPKLDFGMDGVEFDFGVKLDIDGFRDLSGKETLQKLLPGAGKLVLKAIEDMIVDVKEKMIPKFKELAELIEELVGSVGEVFSDPMDKIKEAFGNVDDMFAIPKAVAAAGLNAKTVAVEPIRVISTFKDTMVRVKDEFSAAFEETKAIMA
uniref:Uncharacterized protein n=2 Tax=Chlamydomonas euryale TaxID=1486919 RepID=A0A7R9VV16_9CHLO